MYVPWPFSNTHTGLHPSCQNMLVRYKRTPSTNFILYISCLSMALQIVLIIRLGSSSCLVKSNTFPNVVLLYNKYMCCNIPNDYIRNNIYLPFNCFNRRSHSGGNRFFYFLLLSIYDSPTYKENNIDILILTSFDQDT